MRERPRLALEVPGMSREELKDRGEELETEFEYRKDWTRYRTRSGYWKRTS